MGRPKIQKLTGDPTIDCWIEMKNNRIRKKRKQAPLELSQVEYKLVKELIPTIGVGRIITGSHQNALYVKDRVRRWLSSVGIGEMIATSVIDNELIVWRIAKWGIWRIMPPVEENVVWKASRAQEVTLEQITKRIDDEDLSTIKMVFENEQLLPRKERKEVNPISPQMLKEIWDTNLESGMITKEEYDEKMRELNIVV